MNFKLVLLSATAIGLATGSVLADENSAFIVQSGLENSASILQSGTQIRAGLFGDPLNQNGDHNIIVLDQTGPGGAASAHGRSRASVGEKGLGVDQIGNYNKLQIIQDTHTTNWEMSVDEVQQIATGATGAEITNDVYVNQSDFADGHNSRIVRIRQTYTGDGTLAADRNKITVDQSDSWQLIGANNGSDKGLFQIGKGNTIDIDQTGKKNEINRVKQDGQYNSVTIYQNGIQIGQLVNRVTLLEQLGDNNTASVSQSGGTGNRVASLIQNNQASGSIGNRANLSFVGSYNGDGDFSGAALSMGLTQATALQLGDDNELTYNVTGSNNLFAFSQTGDGNTITSFVVGDGNEVAALQSGNANTAVANQTGSNNNVAISQ